MSEDQNRPYYVGLVNGSDGMHDVRIDGHVVVPGVSYGTAIWLAEKLNEAFQRGRLAGVSEAEDRTVAILGTGATVAKDWHESAGGGGHPDHGSPPPFLRWG